jgi:eukaryotic-like serine/threonine-protein kinase
MNEKLGKYEIITLLGEGATAHVYHALDTQLHRDVALKILKPKLVADDDSFRRFVQEAQAAAGLFHPNLATVLEMGEENGRFFISMRYVEGKSLARVLEENGPLSWVDVKRMASEIGSALDFAHKKEFLHRDVKPNNIIVSEDGDFVLTDFGLTRAMMNTGITSHTGAILGTPAYIAPEVWQGEEVGPAADQYALGCVLIESLTGKTLFDGDTPPRIMTQHVLNGAEIPKKWPKGVPPKVGGLLSKALAKESAKRFKNLEALSTALAQLEKPKRKRPAPLPASPAQEEAPDLPAQTAEGKPAAKTRKKTINYRWPAVIAVILLLGMIGGSVFMLLKGKIGSHNITVDTASEIIALQTLPAGGVVDLDISPDGAQVAVLAASRVNLLSSETLQRDQAFDFEYGSLTRVLWSPDGERIALIDHDERVLMIDSESGESLLEITVRVEHRENSESGDETSLVILRDLAWSPDADRLATVDSDGFLKIWDAAAGNLVSSYGGLGESVSRVVWSPDGGQLAVASSVGIVELLNVSQGKFETFADISSWGAVRNIVWSPDSRLLAIATAGQIWVKNVDSGGVLYENALWVTDLTWSPDGDFLAVAGETITLLDTTEWIVLGTLVGDTGRVNAITFTPDGGRLLSGGVDGSLHLWNMDSGLDTFTVTTSAAINQYAWNLDHSLLALSVGEQSIQIWDVQHAALVTELDFQAVVEYLSWSRDGDRLAVITSVQEPAGKEIVIWNQLQNKITTQTVLAQNRPVTALGWSPQDDRIAVTQDGSYLSLLNVVDPNQALVFDDRVYGSISWSPDQERIASVYDARISLWSTMTGSLENTIYLEWDDGDIQRADDYRQWASVEEIAVFSNWALAWSPDGGAFAGLIGSQQAVVWDSETGNAIAYLDAGEDLSGIAWSVSGGQLYLVASHRVIVWDREDRLYLGTFDAANLPDADLFSGENYAVYRTGDKIGDRADYEGEELLGPTPAPTQLPEGMASGKVSIYQIHSPQITRQISSGHTGSVTSMDLDNEGRYLVSSSKDDTFILWDLAQGQVVDTFDGHMWGVRSVDLHPADNKVASGDGLGTVRVWDLAAHELIYELEAHFGAINRVAWSPNGVQLATAGMDGVIRLWVGDSGKPSKTFSWQESNVLDLAWSPGGDLLASAGSDGQIRVLQAIDGNLVANWQVEQASSLAWSPDGKVIAVSSLDGRITIYDILEKNSLYAGNLNSAIYDLSWSPDSHLLAAGGYDGLAVFVYDNNYSLQGNTRGLGQNSVYSVVWEVGDVAALLGMSDGTIQIFGLDGVELESIAGQGKQIQFVPTATITLAPLDEQAIDATSTPAPTTVLNQATVQSKLITPTPTLNPAYIPPSCVEAGEIWTSPTDGATLVCILAGEFKMGSDDGEDDERPVTDVYLDSFWMDQTEVTNAMYAQCVNAHRCNPPSDQIYFFNSWETHANHPVVSVSWNDAQNYCSWAGRHLPTEAQWEKAARGGLEGMIYPWGNDDPVCVPGAVNGAQYESCNGQTVSVGSFSANGYGLYDMAGNVWEWVSTLYASYPYNVGDGREVIGGEDSRVLRSGSFYYDAGYIRSANRGKNPPDDSNTSIGFRCARSAATP